MPDITPPIETSPVMACITKKRLDELEEKERLLNALYAAGVDNWEGYSDVVQENIHNEKEVS
jgi:hypothetical protein